MRFIKDVPGLAWVVFAAIFIFTVIILLMNPVTSSDFSIVGSYMAQLFVILILSVYILSSLKSVNRKNVKHLRKK